MGEKFERVGHLFAPSILLLIFSLKMGSLQQGYLKVRSKE
jgi:hypothetical protein